jgi:hypothetical protein
MGLSATLSAARDFPHRRIVNRPGESGTLSNVAIVTQSEMVEHSFYQGLNLWQAVYLHVVTWAGWNSIRGSMGWRLVALWLVTCPWMFRKWFPVNSFSANWTTTAEVHHNDQDEKVHYIRIGDNSTKNEQTSTIKQMYQIKKWQYVFYKHVVLHGLNISMAFPEEPTQELAMPTTSEWRIFWLCLNTSYVMEFFMQSLVKRGVLSQSLMLVLQWILMISSSLASVAAVMWRVRYDVVLVSLMLNFLHRGHDVVNTMIVGCYLLMCRSNTFLK